MPVQAVSAQGPAAAVRGTRFLGGIQCGLFAVVLSGRQGMTLLFRLSAGIRFGRAGDGVPGLVGCPGRL